MSDDIKTKKPECEQWYYVKSIVTAQCRDNTRHDVDDLSQASTAKPERCYSWMNYGSGRVWLFLLRSCDHPDVEALPEAAYAEAVAKAELERRQSIGTWVHAEIAFGNGHKCSGYLVYDASPQLGYGCWFLSMRGKWPGSAGDSYAVTNIGRMMETPANLLKPAVLPLDKLRDLNAAIIRDLEAAKTAAPISPALTNELTDGLTKGLDQHRRLHDTIESVLTPPTKGTT